MTEPIAAPAVVTAGGLRRILASVGPFAARSDRTELLESVHLSCRGGQLIAVATDLRIAAEDRTDLLPHRLQHIPAELPPVLLHATDAARLQMLLTDLDELPVTIRTYEPCGLVVEVGRDRFHVGSWDHRAAGAYPDMRPVLDGDMRYLPRPAAPIPLDRTLLARFAHVANADEPLLLDWGADRPTRLRIGATFRAAVINHRPEGTAR